MNANEYKLQKLSDEIKYYELKSKAVQSYLNVKQKRDELLDEISRNW